MGAHASKLQLAQPFHKLADWAHADVQKLLGTFKELELPPSLDQPGLRSLVYGAYLIVEPDQWSWDVIRAFSGVRNGRMLVLPFIAGAALCASGSPHKATELVFRVFDLSGARRLQFNEMLILLINVSIGLKIMTAGARINADFALTQSHASAITQEAFAMFGKGEGGTISDAEFGE